MSYGMQVFAWSVGLAALGLAVRPLLRRREDRDA